MANDAHLIVEIAAQPQSPIHQNRINQFPLEIGIYQ
jgi:hypothetical protein